MKKDSNKSEGFRLDGVNIYDYKFKEYLCYFDLKTNTPDRIRNLALGLQLFRGNGLSQAQFLKFQNHRQLIAKLMMGGIIVLLLAIDIVSFGELLLRVGIDLWYHFYLFMLGTAIAIVIFYAVRVWSKTIRANFTHVNTVLSSHKCLKLMQSRSLGDQELFRAIANGVEDGDFDNLAASQNVTITEYPAFNNLPASLGGLTETSHVIKSRDDTGNMLMAELATFETTLEIETKPGGLHTFRHELLELSQRQNRFNELPMMVVIDFFNIMCCPACKSKVPQMTESDFLRFLKSAFLGDVLGDKIKLHKRMKMMTREIFHQFMLKSIKDLDLPLTGQTDTYMDLLSDHFQGFEKENTANNFRTEIDDRLEKLRNDYKTELQFLQWLQTDKRQ